MEEPKRPSPPPAGSLVGAAPRPAAWWQHWQVVLSFVVAAFFAGVAAGTVTWMALRDDSEASVGGVADAGGLPQGVIDGLAAPRHDGLGPDPAVAPLPEAELSVASDGCGVIRSDMGSEPHGLQWSIMDTEGFQVLGRNALGETRYRYFEPGTYTVELVAWDGEKYASISNTVTISC